MLLTVDFCPLHVYLSNSQRRLLLKNALGTDTKRIQRRAPRGPFDLTVKQPAQEFPRRSTPYIQDNSGVFYVTAVQILDLAEG